MEQQVVFKKRFQNKHLRLLNYLNEEFGMVAVERYNKQLQRRITIIRQFPESGQITVFESIRSILIAGRVRIFYRLEKNEIVILNMFDLEQHSAKMSYSK